MLEAEISTAATSQEAKVFRQLETGIDKEQTVPQVASGETIICSPDTGTAKILEVLRIPEQEAWIQSQTGIGTHRKQSARAALKMTSLICGFKVPFA